MLVASVIIYMIATIAIGAYGARMVQGSKDFMVAGRSLPLYMNFACVFATWFGAETVLSVSATFTKDGLSGISGDPFGASFCLVVVALFFARTFYRMELLTIGDFYHKRYGKFVEVFTSLGIASSYLGWTSAQLSALGLTIHVLFDIDLTVSIMIGACVVTCYTMIGGMWSVALTDVVQSAAIVVGLTFVAGLLANQAGGVDKVIEHAYHAGKLNPFPEAGETPVETTAAWLAFIGAFLTMALGSIPQQDVFQRVTSAKNERTAIIGTFAGGLFYFVFAFVPMFIAYSAIVIAPESAELFKADDARLVQRILPDMVLRSTPMWCQILFFGALLSAILSTASGTLLAPSSILCENVLQPVTKHLSDRMLLWLLRCVLVLVAVTSTWISLTSSTTMYEMVEAGYSVTLVTAFVPLALGVYWSKASTQGAIFSLAFGVPAWLGTRYGLYSAENPVGFWDAVPPQLYGVAASLVGMVIGSVLPQFIRQAHPADYEHGDLRRPIASH